jgi:hypothetical protein
VIGSARQEEKKEQPQEKKEKSIFEVPEEVLRDIFKKDL